MNRNQHLSRGLDLSRPGLEIGALHNPCIAKSGSKVLYVDHLPTEQLKAKYAADGFPHCDDIKDVDIVVGPAGLLDAIGDHRFAYVVASHVIEHIANPIRWLREIHTLLEPGGVLSLAIPDKRFCFDRLRSETGSAQWVEAYIRDDNAPSPGRIFDALHNEVTLNGEITWSRDVDPGFLRHLTHPREALRTAIETFRSGAYRDVHCSTFIPASFFRMVRQLAVLDLFDFEVAYFVDTIGHEFFVHLRKLDTPDWTRQIASMPIMRDGRFVSVPTDFDAGFYLRTYQDVAAARLDPVEHYLNYGRQEGRLHCAPT
jgi:SAM-dependent methyltransferase